MERAVLAVLLAGAAATGAAESEDSQWNVVSESPAPAKAERHAGIEDYVANKGFRACVLKHLGDTHTDAALRILLTICKEESK